MGAKRKLSAKKKIQNETTKKVKPSKIPPSENISTRITRSKLSQTETVEKIVKVPVKNYGTRNTRSKSTADILPIVTRSKSKKIEVIDNNNTALNEREPLHLADKPKIQTKSLVSTKTQFVKLNDFEVNSIVLAKQKYSFPWPAKVLKIEKKRVFVYFFGDKRSGHVGRDEIYDFILSSKGIKSIIASKKTERSYATGVAEIEMLLGITSENSLL